MVVEDCQSCIGGPWMPAASPNRFTVINVSTEEPIRRRARN